MLKAQRTCAAPTAASESEASYWRARAGDEYARQSYLRRFEGLPEAKSAMRRGDLAGIIYVPDVSTAAEILERIYSSANLAGAPTLGDAGDESSREAKVLIRGALASAEPIGYSYAMVPQYILVSPLLFGSLPVRNSCDVTACIMHELKHVEDGRYGVTIDGVRMEPSGGFGFRFLESIAEVRAYSAEFGYVQSRGIEASVTYLHDAYRNHVDFCNGLSRRTSWNEKEYLYGEKQLLQFPDLTITRSGGRYEVSFGGK